MQLSREAIKRMFETAGQGSTTGVGSLSGYATTSYVQNNFVSIDFFNRLFAVHGEETTYDEETQQDVTTEVDVLPNDLNTLINHIEAKFGFWTNDFLSALGLNNSGGGGGVTLEEPLRSINQASLGAPTSSDAGKAIVWNGSAWTYDTAGGSSGIDMTTVWAALLATTNEQIASTHLTTALSSYATQSYVGQNFLSLTGGTMSNTNLVTNLNADLLDGHESSYFATSSDLTGVSGRVTTLEGYFTSGSANSAVKLKTARTLWGQSFDGTANVTGSLSSVTNITMSGKISIGGFEIEYDSTNNALKFGGNIYASGGVSALGIDSQGQSLVLNEPLASINDANLSAPTSSDAGKAIVWNGSAWTYATAGSGSGTVTSVALSAPTGFKVTGSPITGSGTLILSFASGYSLPTTTKQGHWDTAYGWGDHSQAGYLTTTSGTFWGQSWTNGGTVTGSLTGVVNITMTGSIVMANNTSVQMKDTNGNNRVLLTLNANTSGSILSLGYGTRLAGLDTRIEGNTVNFTTGTGTDAAVIDEDGMLWIKEAESGIRIGDGLITWDSTYNALKISKYDGTAAHLYALGGISALGISTNSGEWERIYFDSDHYIFLDGDNLKFYNGTSNITIA